MHSLTQKTRMFVTMFAMTATAAAATTAQAGNADATFARYDDVVVNYSDLNLKSAAGNKVLYARLTSAAERACGSAPATRDVHMWPDYRACVASKLSRAVDQIGTRELQALHHRTIAAHRAG